MAAKKRKNRPQRQSPALAGRKQEPPPPQDGRRALVLALLALMVYNANFRLIAAGDSYPARFLPFALWNHGTLHFDPIREAVVQKNPNPYWIQPTPDGHWASLYPIVVPLLVAPLYLPAALYARWAGETYERLSWLGEILEKLSASLIAAVAVGWMYLLLRRRLTPRDATLLTLVFAFATETWTIGSQALWQHGTAELLCVGTLWFVTAGTTTRNLLAAGLLAGLLAANRPPDLLLAAAFGLYALLAARWRAAWFAAAAALPMLLTAGYNLLMFHRWSGGYGVLDFSSQGFFHYGLLPGLAGLLVSPARGLFVYSPFFLFLPILFHRTLAERSTRALTLCLAAGIALQLLLYARTDWRAGFSYGYRFLTDLVPILVWMLAPVLASLGRPARAAFLSCCLISLWIQTIGAFKYTGISDLVIMDAEMRHVWKIEDAPILVERRQARAPFDLLHKALNPPSAPPR
ncbi:MAG: hypothetical protein WAM82_32315 [Thermoanaerobaculia bacterium]